MENHTDPLRKIPTKHAPEARADIGSALKAARTKKGHTLEAVAQQTRIPKKFLDALENNRFDEFPALAYLRGFLKSYCDYLEVEFDPLWRQISEPAKEPTPAPTPVARPSPAPVAAASATKPAAAAKAQEKKAEPVKTAAPKPEAKPLPRKQEEPTVTSHPKPAHHAPSTAAHGGHGAHGEAAPAAGPVGPIMLALVLGLLGSIGFFAATSRVPAPPPPEVPGALGFVRPPAERALTLEFRQEAWASVTIDGKVVFEGKVPQGAKQEWKTDKTVELRLSQPEAVRASVGGAELKLPAPDAGGVIRLEAP